MNQMGHQFPNMIGVKPGSIDRSVQAVLPDYMTMGQDGMGDMAEMGMRVPENSIPMVGGPGKHDYITMGGMFTVLKVRDGIASYEDPGWYENPPGTQAYEWTGDMPEAKRASDASTVITSSPGMPSRG